MRIEEDERERNIIRNIISDEVFSDDADNKTGRSYVLLNTAIDYAVIIYVHRFR